MIMNDELGRMWKEVSMLFYVLLLYLPGGTREKYRQTLKCLIFGQISEARSCTMEMRNPVMFSDMERWEDNIKMDLKVGFDNAYQIKMAMVCVLCRPVLVPLNIGINLQIGNSLAACLFWHNFGFVFFFFQWISGK
jgi:hypothetical protein